MWVVHRELYPDTCPMDLCKKVNDIKWLQTRVVSFFFNCPRVWSLIIISMSGHYFELLSKSLAYFFWLQSHIDIKSKKPLKPGKKCHRKILKCYRFFKNDIIIFYSIQPLNVSKIKSYSNIYRLSSLYAESNKL